MPSKTLRLRSIQRHQTPRIKRLSKHCFSCSPRHALLDNHQSVIKMPGCGASGTRSLNHTSRANTQVTVMWSDDSGSRLHNAQSPSSCKPWRFFLDAVQRRSCNRSQKNFHLGGPLACQSSLAPLRYVMPKKKAQKDNDAVYVPSGVHRQMNLFEMLRCNTKVSTFSHT